MKRYEVRTWSRVGHEQRSEQRTKNPWKALKKHIRSLPARCKRTVYATNVFERI